MLSGFPIKTAVALVTIVAGVAASTAAAPANAAATSAQVDLGELAHGHEPAEWVTIARHLADEDGYPQRTRPAASRR